MSANERFGCWRPLVPSENHLGEVLFRLKDQPGKILYVHNDLVLMVNEIQPDADDTYVDYALFRYAGIDKEEKHSIVVCGNAYHDGPRHMFWGPRALADGYLYWPSIGQLAGALEKLDEYLTAKCWDYDGGLR